VQADVGTAPNEIPVNGMLGDMAYQSSDGVSAAKLEVETLEVTGTVPDSLTIEHDTNPTLYLKRAGTPNGYIKSVDANGTETSGIQLYGSEVRLRTGASTRWTIDASGNLVAAAASDIVMPDNAVAALEIKEGGNVYFRFVTTNGAEKIEAYKPITASSGIVMGGSSGIDFGSGATLSDYEEGTFTPTIYYANTSGLTISYTTQTGRYVRVGDLVSVHAYLIWTVTGTPANDNIGIGGLPHQPNAARQYLQCIDSQGQSAAAECSSVLAVATSVSSSFGGSLADEVGAGTHTMLVHGTYQTS